MNAKMRKVLALVVGCSMLTGTVFSYNDMQSVFAAAGPKLSKKSITVKKGKSAKVKLQKSNGTKKIKWSISNKRVAKIQPKKASVTIKGNKAGATKLTCQFIYRGKKKKLVCKVLVKNVPKPPVEERLGGDSVPSSAAPTAASTSAPQQTGAPGSQGATDKPSVTPVPTATPEPIPVLENVDANTTYDIQGSLKGAYGRFFGNVGTSVNIFQIDSSFGMFGDADDMFEFVKSQYNSITPENETKPIRLLNPGSGYFGSNFEAQTMSVEEAKANPYYYVPDSYKEEVCPQINYSQFDLFLKKAAENGIRIRFHAFVWHQQTPKWLFKENFDAGGDWVTPEVMDARMEYYIKSVIRYICLKEEELGYGDVVYCYDVANEYFHNNDGQDSNDKYIKSYWDEVYYPDNQINVNTGGYTQTTEPAYIKKAFTYAREILDSYGKEDITLFYNDYNTYQVTDKILALTEYINKEKKLCDGVGMQSHLDVGYPTVDGYTEALTKFLQSEYISEVQITELDVTAYGSSERQMERQMTYYYDLMKSILGVWKSYPDKMTGMTFWGLYDDFSWRRDGRPLLFASTSKAKGVYYKVLQAAAETVAELAGTE